MKEQICEQCGAEFELEAGDDSTVCASCLIELKREGRVFRGEPRTEGGSEID